MKNRIIKWTKRVRIIKDKKASPALETAAIITFIGLIVVSKAGGIGTAIGGAFDAIVTGITKGLS